MKYLLFGSLCLTAVSCLSGNTVSQRDEVVEELRSAVADARHSQAVYQTELELLDDRFHQQVSATEQSAGALNARLDKEFLALERKVASLELEQDRLLDEIAQMRRASQEQNQDLAQEMQGIKGVLEHMMDRNSVEVAQSDFPVPLSTE